MKGFVLPVVLILLTIIMLTVNVALQDLGQTGLSLHILSARQQLLKDADTQIALMVFRLTGRKLKNYKGEQLAKLLASSVSLTNNKLCESRAYWLQAELIWHKLKLNVSSRWAFINNVDKFCSARRPGWQQTDWRE